MDKVYGLLANVTITVGQTKGETCLPLPPIDLGSAGSSSKERIYLLESAIITWTKQIRNVLKQDPERMLKAGVHPTPDVEITFWKNKAANLNSIFAQVCPRPPRAHGARPARPPMPAPGCRACAPCSPRASEAKC